MMNKLLSTVGYTDEIDYKERMLYIITLCTAVVAAFFLVFYFIAIPFLPAIIAHIILVTFVLSLYISLKRKNFNFVRYALIIAHIVQLSLAVFVWFPYDTGYNLYYFMVPLSGFLIMDYAVYSQRMFAIYSSLLSTFLYMLSELAPNDYYMYETSQYTNYFLKTMSIITILVPMTFIFAKFAKDLYETQKELEFLANTDTLTNTSNRRVLYDTGDAEFKLANKYNYQFTILLLDIDHFKLVNDQYGHPAGDTLLKKLTALISENIRREDTFSRYGGEEFAILLHRTSKDDGLAIATKLLDIIRKETFRIEDIDIKITVSIGLTQYSNEFKDFDHMMKIVDKALYEAKDNGRNQIVVK